MIGGRVLSWAIVAAYAVVGVASSQLMLCFHQDGRTQIELAALLCCETPSESSGRDCTDGCSEKSTTPCPDDQCQDMPLTLVSPQVSSAPVLDVPAVVTDLWLADLPDTALETPATSLEDSSHSRDHPPESSSRDFLRTVILRL